jgi:hypothetical protein
VKRWTLFEIWARTPRTALASFLIFFLTILIAGPCWADDASTKAARELAQKIAAQIDHKKKVIVEVVDLTGEMRPADLDDAKKVIESELRARGCSVVSDATYETKLRVSLSQDLSELMWVADFENEGAHVVSMAPFERSSLDVRPWMKGVHLDRELIFSDTSQFLDFVPCHSSANETCGAALVLYPTKIMDLRSAGNFPSPAFIHEKPWPRDLRGKIWPFNVGFEMRLEGVACAGDLPSLNARCVSEKNAWSFWGPRGVYAIAMLASGQNWFTWMSTSPPGNNAQAKHEPFFSIAGLEVNGETGWITSGTDGKVRIISNKTGETIGTTSGWGSELATVKTECGNGWQILTTRPHDYTEADAVTVYEWTGSEFRALTDPLEMDGTIVSMWSADGEGPTRVVVHNLKTGNYEAYLLKVGCSQ